MNELKLNEPNFMNAIEKEHYVKNECFINSFFSFFMVHRYFLRKRELSKLLSIINKTEDNVKYGIKLNDVIPFFTKYKFGKNPNNFGVFFLVICETSLE